MTPLCIAIVFGLTAASTPSSARVPGPPNEPVASALVDALNDARSERGLSRVGRDALLDAVASRRARAIALLPEKLRLGAKPPIEALIREAGRKRFATAMQYLAYLGGYADESAAAVRTWKEYTPGWEQALGPSWTEAGAATARAGDGTLVIVVVLLERDRPLPAADAIEGAVFSAVNGERKARGLAPLALEERLAGVARAHSEDMLRRGYFDHVSPDGVHAADRVSAAGIAFKKVAENLFESQRADDPIAAAVTGWMLSSGHRGNIVDPAFTHTGVGIAVDSDEGVVVVTQLFLRPQEERAVPAAGP